MLEELTVKNFGIIEDVTISFSGKLNILTGETGAGKSILIDALRFCLGERFQSSYLRDQAESLTVEAVFCLSPQFIKTLPDNDLPPIYDGSLVLQRTVFADGRNRIKVNGLTATVAQLKELGSWLIDFHGPHDHQLLFSEHQHQIILDSLTDLGPQMADYKIKYQEYASIRQEISALQQMAQGRERELDLLSHQIRELEQVPLDQAHLDSMKQTQSKIANAEKLFEHLTQAMSFLDNDEASLETMLSRAYKPLEKLAQIDEKSAPLIDVLARLQENAAALLSSLREYADSLNFDPAAAQKITEQFDAYQDIQKKYGPGLEDASKFYTDAKARFELLNNYEINERHLLADLKTKETELQELAKIFTQRRKKTALWLKKTIEEELAQLGFKSVVFDARIEKNSLGPTGSDKVLFFISTNAGESLKPLADIVSSGEAARLMLAIKRALMKADPVPVLIFDEVDAQIGGRLGTVIGTKLTEIALYRQVILITHLPQIAAFAETHHKIRKSEEKGRTKVLVEPLHDKTRLHEIAHMMAGDKMTPAALKHAMEMIEQAKQKVTASAL
jgi:DNA repair protein RecN (Recombination protein N)